MEAVEAQMENTEVDIGIYRRKKTWLVAIQPWCGFKMQEYAQRERERERDVCGITVVCNLEN